MHILQKISVTCLDKKYKLHSNYFDQGENSFKWRRNLNHQELEKGRAENGDSDCDQKSSRTIRRKKQKGKS